MVRIETVLGDEEYRLMSDLKYDTDAAKKGRRIMQTTFAVLGACFLGLGLYRFGEYSLGLNLFYLLFAAFLFVMAFLTGPLIRKRIYSGTKKNCEALNVGPFTCTFDEDEIGIISNIGESIFKWNTVEVFGEKDHYLWIRKKDQSYMVIDKNRTSAEDAERVKMWLIAHNIRKLGR